MTDDALQASADLAEIARLRTALAERPPAGPYEAIKTTAGHWRVWEGDRLLCECGDGEDAEQRARTIADSLNELHALPRLHLEEALAQSEQRERQAKDILGRIAQATADQGVLFFQADGSDDWDAAIAWLTKHLSFTPEQSMREQHAEVVNEWRHAARECEQRERAAVEEKEALRREMLSVYGAICVCCGETEPLFLELDHTNGGGTAHRRIIGRGSKTTYAWLKRQGWPREGYQVLCANCNQGRQRNGGICPHQQRQ